MRGEALFKDPDTFDPERYLVPVDEETAKRLDPKNYCFGFGRRVRLAYLFCLNLPITIPSRSAQGGTWCTRQLGSWWPRSLRQ